MGEDDGQGEREHRQPRAAGRGRGPRRAGGRDPQAAPQGKVSSLEALDELPGVGPATFAQLRSLLDFTDQAEEPTREAAEGTMELGRALTDLVQEQIRHNFETWTALAGAVDWEQVFQIQREFLRVSLERAARLTQRCLEAARGGMIAAASATLNQARNAA